MTSGHKSATFKTMKRGFTILELIVVMTIMGLILTVGLSSYFNSLSRSRDGKRKSDIKAIQVALELYHEKNHEYPKAAADKWFKSTDSLLWIPGLTSEYIRQMPIDPLNNGGDAPETGPPFNFAYYYYSYKSPTYCDQNGGDFYILTTRLENQNDQDTFPFKDTLITRDPVTGSCDWPHIATDPLWAQHLYVVTNP